jgi:hypothetical protein
MINHVSAEALTTGRKISSGTIVHQQKYRPNDSNKNVKIKLSAHDIPQIKIYHSYPPFLNAPNSHEG